MVRARLSCCAMYCVW